MSGFTASELSTLDYDFTGIPSQVNPGQNCTGKGVVPEPNDERLNGFFEARAELAKDPGADSITKLREVLTAFCAGAPTAEEIAELPPRALGFFVRWLFDQVSGGGDPKG